MTRIYRYILETDGGMAPCAQNGLISLGTCKPAIRRTAKIGDWVAGFMPGTMRRGQLVWAGKVSEKLTHDEYRKRFSGRRDAVYGLARNGKYRSDLPGYHCDPTQQERDSANPVLLFDQTHSRYVGCEPEAMPDDLMHLAAAGIGHRVNFRRDGDLELWEDWLSQLSSSHGEPRDTSSLCGGCIHCSGNGKPGQACGGPSGKTKVLKKPGVC